MQHCAATAGTTEPPAIALQRGRQVLSGRVAGVGALDADLDDDVAAPQGLRERVDAGVPDVVAADVQGEEHGVPPQRPREADGPGVVEARAPQRKALQAWVVPDGGAPGLEDLGAGADRVPVQRQGPGGPQAVLQRSGDGEGALAPAVQRGEVDEPRPALVPQVLGQRNCRDPIQPAMGKHEGARRCSSLDLGLQDPPTLGGATCGPIYVHGLPRRTPTGTLQSAGRMW
mmetsp:Transcript_3262/g.10502  ORF Transcript_3262/g.10502 Transcript_3262/m.10502 type:complete len:229 (-) Transcript_3262:90-776(-)